MKRLLIMAMMLVLGVATQAQTKKEKPKDTLNLRVGVLVVGQGNAALAAALQSAKSGVETILLSKQKSYEFVPSDYKLKTGIEAAFLNKLRVVKGIKDSTAIVPVDNEAANSAFFLMSATMPKLKVISNIGWNKFDRSSGGWYVKLDDGRTIKATVLVYATQEVLSSDVTYKKVSVTSALDYSNNLYRTSIAGNSFEKGPAITSLYNIVSKEDENLVVANSTDADMATGQAAGATGAYGSYFGVKTSDANLKIIQGELLNYKLNLMPFVDVVPTDTNWRAIQNVGLMGVLKADIKNGAAYFNPESKVVYSEIKQPIKDLYYKAQIWFDDHVDVPINAENMITMVSYVGNKSPENTKIEMEKRWKTSYLLASDFDLKRPLTRREFSAIINDFIKPFDVLVDRTGRVTR